ncbi:MAG: phosphatase PAP2 family protein, partial [Solirubrobacterales bacterium]
TMICAVFDLGLIGYFVVPTAPPWWAAERGRIPGMRRIMAEVGQRVWGRLWSPLYGFLGGNPLAAMPSLHFATSLMAARMLAEAGPAAGAAGWTYTGVLGFALVYLGEHYVVDLAAGAALAETIRRLGPRAAPALEAVARHVRALEERVA